MPLPAALDVSDDRAVEAARRALFERVRAYVDELSEGGRYDCCVKTPCSHCALMAGGCRCGEGARRGEPVCEECAYLWTRGQGDEPGVDPASVRSFLEASRAAGAGGQGEPCACGREGEERDAGGPDAKKEEGRAGAR